MVRDWAWNTNKTLVPLYVFKARICGQKSHGKDGDAITKRKLYLSDKDLEKFDPLKPSRKDNYWSCTTCRQVYVRYIYGARCRVVRGSAGVAMRLGKRYTMMPYDMVNHYFGNAVATGALFTVGFSSAAQVLIEGGEFATQSENWTERQALSLIPKTYGWLTKPLLQSMLHYWRNCLSLSSKALGILFVWMI